MKGPSLGNKLEGRNVVASLTYLSSLLCVIEEIIIDVLVVAIGWWLLVRRERWQNKNAWKTLSCVRY